MTERDDQRRPRTLGGGQITVNVSPPITVDVIGRAQLEARLAETRIMEHRAGHHPYGCMRRDCPLCLAGR